jgi:insulysin
MADVDSKFKQKTPASWFTSRTSAWMQKPMPREWLLSGQSRLRQFNPEAIGEGLVKICPENMRLMVVSQKFPGDWDKREKWYGTEYRYGKLPESQMAGFKDALECPSDKHLAELHLPGKDNFIPNELNVEKNEVLQPALSPRLLRNDGLARTWWKKDDTFCLNIFEKMHSGATPMRPLRVKTLRRITCDFSWPRITAYVRSSITSPPDWELL